MPFDALDDKISFWGRSNDTVHFSLIGSYRKVNLKKAQKTNQTKTNISSMVRRT